MMVRVGGGWDTLEHYLETHDPCRTIEMCRPQINATHNNIHDLTDVVEGEDKYLYIKSKYKSPNKNV